MSPTIAELRRGYTAGQQLSCLHCKATFLPGRIYDLGEHLADAELAARHHVDSVHGGPLAALLAQGKAATGLSEIQRTVVELSAGGATDAEIGQALGDRSPSTVRNHRFQLRRRTAQARAYLALMELLDQQADQDFVDYHAALPMRDDRAVVTRTEADKLLDKYFQDESHSVLDRFPRREKHKLVVLRHLVQRFEPGRRYTEKQVNALLKQAFGDYAVLRRWLVDYRFLGRERDGSAYWRTDS